MKNIKQITLKGIDRASGRFTDQGILQEAINVRKRNSANYQVVGKKDVIAEFQHDTFGVDLEAYTILYRFPALDTYELIGADDITQRIYKIELTEVTNILNYSGDVKLITHLGNILIIHTTLYVYYLKYDTDLDTFTELHSLPVPQFFCMPDYDRRIDGITTAPKTTFTAAIAEYVYKAAQMRKDGAMEGHILCVLAWRLYDNTYIKHSQIMHCLMGKQNSIYDPPVIYMDEDLESSTTSGFGFRGLTFDKILGQYFFNTTDKAVLPDWVGIASSLCLFISQPMSIYTIDTAEDKYTWTGVAGSRHGVPPLNLDVAKLDQAVTGFYKVHEISLADIIAGTTTEHFHVDAGPIDTLVSNTPLPVDENTNHSLIADHAYLYNSRLHYSNIINYIHPGQNMNAYALEDTEESSAQVYTQLRDIWEFGNFTPHANVQNGWTLTVVTYLHTTEGDRVQMNSFSQADGNFTEWEPVDPNLGYGNYLILNTVISYPDIRAYKQCYYTYNQASGKYYRLKWWANGVYNNHLSLTPHPFHNYASNINWSSTRLRPEPRYFDITGVAMTAFEITEVAFLAETQAVYNPRFSDINRIQLTGLNNPFVHPAGNSYRVGNHHNTVVATASMGESISQGQFGQFPLYAFSTQGIWTLEVGSGEVVYGSIHPLNSDVLMVNVYDPKVRMLCNIGMGIVYATSKGLFMITGNQVQEISTAIEGRNDNPVLTKNEYDGYISTDCFVILKDYLSNIPFIEYLDDAIIGYDRKNKEIIISSRSYNDLHTYQGAGSTSTQRDWTGTGVGIPMVDDASRAGYSYVFSLVSKEWTKITQRWYTFFDAYPNTYAVVGNCLYDLTVELTDNNQVLLQTRPITIQGHTFKRLLGANIYGHFEPETNTFAAFYVWGSQDGEHWELIQGQQMPFLEHEFISLQRAEWGWCRYFIFMASGQLSCDSFYEGIEIDFIERYTKKLR